MITPSQINHRANREDIPVGVDSGLIFAFNYADGALGFEGLEYGRIEYQDFVGNSLSDGAWLQVSKRYPL